MSIVYCLSIITGVDAYKHDGNTATSKNYIFSSYEKCNAKLNSIIIKKCIERIDDEDCFLSDIVESYFEIGYEETNTKTKLKVDINEINDDELDELYEWAAKGCFIPYSWTYEINEYIIDSDDK
jgi:hypothetical protein